MASKAMTEEHLQQPSTGIKRRGFWWIFEVHLRVYLRMTTTTFNILLEKVRSYIEKKNTVMRNSISAAERLTCSCYHLHAQIDDDKDSVFWLVNLHPSSIQVERKIGCISMPSKSVQVFLFKFLVWYTRSKNLNSRNLNGDLDAKLVSCIPGLRLQGCFP